MSHSHEQIGEEMIIQVMQYCDGTLDPQESALMAQKIAGDPKLRALADDLKLGANAARETMGELINRPVPMTLVRAIVTTPAKRQPWGNVNSLYKTRAAAAITGLLIGAAAMGLWFSSNHQSGLRLAGTSIQDDDNLFSSAFRSALLSALGAQPGLVNKTFNLPGQTSEQGTVSVIRWFALSTGIACAEFTQTLSAGTVSNGIACRRGDGGWELIALPVSRE